jgi:hypothetical protein
VPATVTVRCVACGAERVIAAGEVAQGDYPMCPKCSLPMIVVAAHAPGKIKCLSLRQPWAWAILYANKRIENRIWTTRYRGPFLLHAARGYEDHEVAQARHFMVSKGLVAEKDIPPIEELPRGGVVGKTLLLAVTPPGKECVELPEGIDLRWRMPDQYGFVLGPTEPVPFRPLRGMPGLFDVRDA